MLLIIGLSVAAGNFPIVALNHVDAALATVGFKKEVSSVIRPGKEYSVTYEGPTGEKSMIEQLLKPLAEQHGFSVSIETEESVRFP